MKSKLFISFIVLSIILGLNSSLQAGVTITQITNDSYEDSYPCIKGDYLVWQARVGDDWEIFLFSVSTGELTRITDNDYADMSPQTDGKYVVWQGFRDGEWDIFLWNGSQETPVISDQSAEDVFPQIAAGLVVWTSDPLGADFVGPGKVILYDIETETRMILSANVDPSNTLNDRGPIINDEFVMWEQTDPQGNAVSYLYEISSGAITKNPNYLWQDGSQMDKNLRVLTRHDGHDREIFVHNNDSRRYHQITDNSLHDRYPSISGNHVAWMAGGEIFLAELTYLGLVSPTDNRILSTSPVPTFSWEGIGYDKFRVQFSEGSDFPASNTLRSPVEEESWLSETSFVSTEEEWRAIRAIEEDNGSVYWRVEGKDLDGGVSFSETWSFAIYEGGGGGGGDSGLCFIGTAAH